MTALLARIAAGATRSASAFNALSSFHRAYVVRQLSALRLSACTSRGYAAAATATTPAKATRTTATTRKPRAKATTTRSTKKKVTKKVVKKKAAKPKAKKKKVAAKPKPKKKLPSPIQRERVARKKALENLKELKVAALSPPQPKVTSSYAVYLVAHPGSDLKANAAAWKALSASEKEQYQRTAEHNKQENAVTYQNWILEHTPEQIRQANAARNSLKTQTQKLYPNRKVSGRRAQFTHLKDDRQPKRPKSGYTMYTTERLNGALHGVPVKDAVRSIAKEWKELTPAEKKTYQELSQADKLRYDREFLSAYGYAHVVKRRGTSSASSSTTAASP